MTGFTVLQYNINKISENQILLASNSPSVPLFRHTLCCAQNQSRGQAIVAVCIRKVVISYYYYYNAPKIIYDHSWCFEVLIILEIVGISIRPKPIIMHESKLKKNLYVHTCSNYKLALQILMNAVEQMIASRTALTHKVHLSAHALKDLHLMTIIGHALVSLIIILYKAPI